MAHKLVVTGVTPTFLLRGVDPIRTAEDYLKGVYSNISYKRREDSGGTPTVSGPVATQIATVAEADTYGYRNKSNITQVVATTNCRNFVTFVSASTGEPVWGGRCKYCYREFTHAGLGVPIRLEETDGKLTVYFVDLAGHYECAFALWKRKYNGGTRYRDSRYMDGEMILRHLYALQYPGAPPLREAHDPDLLKCNGGCLDDAEYDAANHVYLPTPSMIWAPVKMQALRYTRCET